MTMTKETCVFETHGNNNCPQCKLVIAATDTHAPGWTLKNHSEGLIDFYLATGAFVLREDSSKKELGKFYLLLKPKDGHLYGESRTTSSLDRRFGLSLDICPDTRLDAAFARAHAWLQHCVANDAACRATGSGRPPRRLLRVGSRESSAISLVSTSHGTEDYSKFACLSYRWGVAPEDIVRTTSANLAEHTRGINLDTLPKTVVDAVTVCRELCIPYLWVDALRIIQKRTDLATDDAATRDWLEEGSRMDQIYGTSHLTIYAEAAATCKEPFLGPQGRGTDAYQRRVAGARAPNGREAFVRKGATGAVMSQYQSVEKSEMSRRGWCYQEALLPSRWHFRPGLQSKETAIFQGDEEKAVVTMV